MGKNDIEDALKKLDRLTQEEARMAAAQLLKVANTINSDVMEVADNVLAVDNRVGNIGAQVQSIDDKVTAVMDGAQYIFYLLSYNCLTQNAPRWKRSQGCYPTNSRRCR